MEITKVVYQHNFGQETYSEIREENNFFQCYETPLYGGEFNKVGEPFTELEKAKEYLHQLT